MLYGTCCSSERRPKRAYRSIRRSRLSSGLFDRGHAAHGGKGRRLPRHLPEGTRVYIAHIEGTPIEDMVATAQADWPRTAFRSCRTSRPALSQMRRRLADWIARYQGEAGVDAGASAGRRRDRTTGHIRQLDAAFGNRAFRQSRLQAPARRRPSRRQPRHRPEGRHCQCRGRA